MSLPLHGTPRARTAGQAALAQALRDTRDRTLALMAACEVALSPPWAVPQAEELNPPLWEFGHIGWFQERWLARNRQRALGVRCDPAHERAASRMQGADALYNSSDVPHATRWQLPLPDVAATRDYLSATLAGTQDLLTHAGEDDDALYFFRLALFHEDMHAEAAVYMAQTLGLAWPEALQRGDGRQPRAQACGQELTASATLQVPAGEWTLGRAGAGFVFDNERGEQTVVLGAFEIDAAPIHWARYLAFVDAGGYADARWWTPEGWRWVQSHQATAPRYLRREAQAEACGAGPGAEGWQHRHFGRWQSLDLQAPAVHLSWYEADAWCRWAGRRLPTEAEWECAAMTQPGLAWGEVWDWTASVFEPFPGFTPHPYRDYSAPWFGTRPVLRGACGATAARMVCPTYRNYFTRERNDIFAGFRSCALR